MSLWTRRWKLAGQRLARERRRVFAEELDLTTRARRAAARAHIAAPAYGHRRHNAGITGATERPGSSRRFWARLEVLPGRALSRLPRHSAAMIDGYGGRQHRVSRRKAPRTRRLHASKAGVIALTNRSGKLAGRHPRHACPCGGEDRILDHDSSTSIHASRSDGAAPRGGEARDGAWSRRRTLVQNRVSVQPVAARAKY